MTIKYNDMVWKILHGMPIEVFDEDDESIWENDTWELVNPRIEGDYKGSRDIGSANLVTALNLLHQRLLIENNTDQDSITNISQKLFTTILDDFCTQKKIRKKPELVRKDFKLVKKSSSFFGTAKKPSLQPPAPHHLLRPLVINVNSG